MKIDQFEGDFEFLSNFADSVFTHDGIVFPTNEHFYQAMKSDSRKERKRIAALMSPGKTKREGRKLTIRKDWESVKIAVMRQGLALKFAEGSVLAEMLKATSPVMLEEGNHWNDRFWGVSAKTGQGKNWLGKLLMERRAQLLEE